MTWASPKKKKIVLEPFFSKSYYNVTGPKHKNGPKCYVFSQIFWEWKVQQTSGMFLYTWNPKNNFRCTIPSKDYQLYLKNDRSYDKTSLILIFGHFRSKTGFFCLKGGPKNGKTFQKYIYFFSGLFVKATVKNNGNELEYAKSAKSEKLEKTEKNPIFGPIWAYLVYFGTKTFFFKKPKTALF